MTTIVVAVAPAKTSNLNYSIRSQATAISVTFRCPKRQRSRPVARPPRKSATSTTTYLNQKTALLPTKLPHQLSKTHVTTVMAISS